MKTNDPLRALEEMRGKLEAISKLHGRKKLFAGVMSESNFARILGTANPPVDNPGVFTVQALAANVGMTVGELLGESGFEAAAQLRDVEPVAAELREIALEFRPAVLATLREHAHALAALACSIRDTTTETLSASGAYSQNTPVLKPTERPGKPVQLTTAHDKPRTPRSK